MVWPASRKMRSACSLSSMVKVEHSAMMRGGRPAAAISFAVAISASGFGRLVMTMGAAAATALALDAISTPALANSLRLAALMSKPTTRQPDLTRLRENAPPMMPSPITPTVFLVFAALIAFHPLFFVAHKFAAQRCRRPRGHYDGASGAPSDAQVRCHMRVISCPIARGGV